MNSSIINSYHSFTMDILSVFAIASGILVIISKNPIVSVLFLIGLFLTVSGYLMMLGLNFIGLSYLLVYVGAISILFLFILMLINIRISELVSLTSNSIPLAIIIGILFICTIKPALPEKTESSLIIDKTFNNFNFALASKNYNGEMALKDNYIHKGMPLEIKGDNNLGFNSDNFAYTSSFTWDNLLADTAYINSLGNILYTTYPLWIILTSLVLLLAMVGCILISIKQNG